MNIALTDSAGHVLTLTTERGARDFDVVTCSPHADGFTMLNSLVGRRIPKPELEMACGETVARNEVCVLPVIASPKWRVFLTPTLRSLDPNTRADATRLMIDLFRASQAEGIAATSLLVTHFAYVGKYPEPHVLGILDALKALSTDSFQDLRLLCIRMNADHLAKFESNVRDAFATQL